MNQHLPGRVFSLARRDLEAVLLQVRHVQAKKVVAAHAYQKLDAHVRRHGAHAANLAPGVDGQAFGELPILDEARSRRLRRAELRPQKDVVPNIPRTLLNKQKLTHAVGLRK
ncbi:hypothetical protein [Paraburkholderia caledonica]|jgi:hypothetical protein|uniref:hypothetical protein n=1 Tax=Paraburkholderia caledonica TaxID=134536 RepID=UPI0012EB5507|nr:hypothetical protein [Paraburkholderia caledonica]